MRVICRKPNATPGRLRARRWRVFWPTSRPAPLAIRASIGCAPSSPAAIGRRRLRQQTRRDAAGKSACDAAKAERSARARRWAGRARAWPRPEAHNVGRMRKENSRLLRHAKSRVVFRHRPISHASQTIVTDFSFPSPPVSRLRLDSLRGVQKYFGRLARLSPVSLRVGVIRWTQGAVVSMGNVVSSLRARMATP